MSGAISATTIAVGAAAGLAATKILAPKKPDIPAAPPAPVAPPAPQAAKTPDPAALRKKNIAAEGAGSVPGAGGGATLLTGPSGVSPDMLNLGKATLLGQ